MRLLFFSKKTVYNNCGFASFGTWISERLTSSGRSLSRVCRDLFTYIIIIIIIITVCNIIFSFTVIVSPILEGVAHRRAY